MQTVKLETMLMHPGWVLIGEYFVL